MQLSRQGQSHSQTKYFIGAFSKDLIIIMDKEHTYRRKGTDPLYFR